MDVVVVAHVDAGVDVDVNVIVDANADADAHCPQVHTVLG